MSVEVGETFTRDLAIIEIDLQKIIEMIAEQESVTLALKLKKNEHVIGHVEIDVGDIFI